MAAALVSPLVSQAGGLYMYEMGTSDLGFANAGSAARAADASTVFSNPAGMTQLDGNQITAAVQVLYGDMEYKLDGYGAANGSDPDNAIGWVPGGSMFYSHSIDDNLKVGFGLYSNFGLSLDLGESWAGSSLMTTSTMAALTFQPTVAYRINNQWSVGAGVTVNYGMFELERERMVDSTKPKLDDHDWAYGARIGVMYEPSLSTRFGLAWSSEVKYEYPIEGDYYRDTRPPHWPDIVISVPLEIDVTAPQQLMFSAYHRLNEKWAVMGNIGWQDWSSFSKLTIEAISGTKQSNLELEDTWHTAVGAQYTLNNKTDLNMGFAYDTSMYKSQSETSFAMPNADSWHFGTGIDYALSAKSDLGVAAEYIYSDDAHDPNALVSGDYDNPYLLFLGVNYTYRF